MEKDKRIWKEAQLQWIFLSLSNKLNKGAGGGDDDDDDYYYYYF